MPNTFHKFVQFAKLEDSKDGSEPTVWGVATWEQPDSDNEICDYEAAVPVYQAWSAKAFKRTSKAGQEPSLGNVRIQHGSEVGGKVTRLDFNDPDKEIWLGSEPISDDVYDLLKQGFYTGYSQGGSYAWRACADCDGHMPMQQGYNYCENCGKNVNVRYGLKRIAEVSYVDSPAIGEGFEHVKANGSCEIVKFQKKEIPVNKEQKTKRVANVELPPHCFAWVGDPEKPATWKLPIEFPGDEEKTKRHIRNALARFDQTQGIPDAERPKVKARIEAAARSHGIDVDGSKAEAAAMFKAAVEKAATAKGIAPAVAKGLFEVARYADLLESMACLYAATLWEREIEGDESEVPDELKSLLDDMVESFLTMATEEARELSANKTETGGKTMTPEELELQKAAKKSLASHFAKAAAHHEKLADHHEQLADEHEEAAAHHTKADVGCQETMGKTKKADVESKDDPHAAIHAVLENQQEYHKAMAKSEMAKAKKHDAIAKAHDKHAEHLHKMAEAHDEETAKAVKAEISAFDAANPEPAAVVKEAAKAPSMDEDVKKAAEAVRGSDEYKQAVAAIAKAQVEAEVAALREKTLAPLGVTIDKETGKALLKAVPHDEGKDAFVFASTVESGNHAGL